MKVLFSLMLVSIIAVTTWASFQENIVAGFHYLFQSRWGIATLFDTYFGFLTVYLWIAYKERNLISRIVWFGLVAAFGSIAFSFYILRELFRLPKGATIEQLLLRREGT